MPSAVQRRREEHGQILDAMPGFCEQFRWRRTARGGDATAGLLCCLSRGIDISGKAIARARALARPGCTFEVADILRYETSERYDVILLREVLYYLPEQALGGFLRRVADWLNPGGKIIIQMWSPGTHAGAIAAIRDCGLPIQQETARQSGGGDERVFLVLSGPRDRA
jgi:SAM-dependent methyltransferase